MRMMGIMIKIMMPRVNNEYAFDDDDDGRKDLS